MKLIEQFLYYSVGFAAQTADKLTKLVQKLIEQGKITKDEAKSFLDEYAQNANDMTEKFDKKLEEYIENTLEETKFVKREDFEKAVKRTEKIEEMLNDE